VFHARLGEQVERLRQEPAWRAGDRNAITLVKTPALSLVLLAVKEGARLHAPGEALVLEPGLEHALEAVRESAVLLTIAGAH
jgi:hypothetical protein